MDEPQEVSPKADKPKQCAGSPDVLGVLKPPAGSSATVALWLGLMLIIISFGVKQIFFNWMVLGINTLMEPEKLSAYEQAKTSELDDDSYKVEGFDEKLSINEIDDKIYVKEREIRQKSEKIEMQYQDKEDAIRKDYEAQIEKASGWEEQSKLRDKMYEKVDELSKEKQKEIEKIMTDKNPENGIDDEIDNLRKQRREVQYLQYEDQNEIDDDYRDERRDARMSQNWEQADMMDNVQWLMWLKFLLDLLKVFGAVLVVLAAMHITADPQANNSLKVYALICGSITLFACLCLGFVTMIG
jgi:hypothetical protein